ncbi:pilus assembly FimT family protein [Thalassotalea piscium]
MKSLQKSKGFTLIELVVVIVILGILAATAAPKFIDLTSDAKKSVMEGVQGSIYSAINLAHAKALVKNQTGPTGEIQIGTKFYALVHGFPSAAHAGTGAGDTGNGYGLKGLIELENGSDVTISDASPAVVELSSATTAADCKITYTNATDNETIPDVTSVLTGC